MPPKLDVLPDHKRRHAGFCRLVVMARYSDDTVQPAIKADQIGQIFWHGAPFKNDLSIDFEDILQRFARLAWSKGITSQDFRSAAV